MGTKAGTTAVQFDIEMKGFAEIWGREKQYC